MQLRRVNGLIKLSRMVCSQSPPAARGKDAPRMLFSQIVGASRGASTSGVPPADARIEGLRQPTSVSSHVAPTTAAIKTEAPRAHQYATSHAPQDNSHGSTPPIIISLALDSKLQDHLSQLRTKYFPPERNYLPGHITLFHALPSQDLEFLRRTVSSRCRDIPPFPVKLSSPKLTKNAAVLLPLKASNLLDLRRKLLQDFGKQLDLTEQDSRRGYSPHLTVVNKVDREEAQRVYDELTSSPQHETLAHGQARGLDLWYYKGGPWEHIESIQFAA